MEKVNHLYPGKLNHYEIEFLKSLGWVFTAYYCISGKNSVEINCPDEYSVYITDKRFKRRRQV